MFLIISHHRVDRVPLVCYLNCYFCTCMCLGGLHRFPPAEAESAAARRRRGGGRSLAAV